MSDEIKGFKTISGGFAEFPVFPVSIPIPDAAIQLYADGSFKGDPDKLEAWLKGQKTHGIYMRGNGEYLMLWLLLREMRRG